MFLYVAKSRIAVPRRRFNRYFVDGMDRSVLIYQIWFATVPPNLGVTCTKGHSGWIAWNTLVGHMKSALFYQILYRFVYYYKLIFLHEAAIAL